MFSVPRCKPNKPSFLFYSMEILWKAKPGRKEIQPFNFLSSKHLKIHEAPSYNLAYTCHHINKINILTYSSV